MPPSPTTPPFLSTAPVRRADQFAASFVIAVSLIVLMLVLPHADRPSSRLVAFIPATDTGFALTYLITATLLIGQFLQVRTLSTLFLSCGYLFACLIVIAHLLSVAQSLRILYPHAANDLVTARLFALWHGIFPLFVAGYALLSQSRYDQPVALRWLFPVAAGSIAVAIALMAATLMVAIAVTNDTPDPATLAHRFAIATRLSLAVTMAALVVLYAKTRARRILDLWLCVVLIAWALDVTVGGLVGGSQFSFGWYAGRIYGILSAGLILSALLLETGSLYARLSRALADMQTQSVALGESDAALRQAQKMEAIGQITGGVAHDFNNLLTVIIGSLDMLRSRERDPRSARLTDFAMAAAVKGEKLTKQLLTFSRRQMLNPEIRNPNRLIRDFDGLMRRALGETIRIALDLQPHVGAIEVDPAQFESAILNLTVNARDAMGGVGAIRIETRAVEHADPGAAADVGLRPYVMIAVADAGSGMDAATLERAFEPFFTTKPPGKGSGLGLSQVYGFVKSSHGFVKIDSAPDKGTTVRLYLPQLSEPAAAEAEPDRPETPSTASGGETVLIVEDDPGVLAVAVESVTELGYDVITATNGPDALERIRADGTIALLFSDIVMPDGMNGIELAVRAREIRPGLNILLTSGYAAAALANSNMLPTDIQIIAKPYRREDLALKFRQIVDGS